MVLGGEESDQWNELGWEIYLFRAPRGPHFFLIFAYFQK